MAPDPVNQKEDQVSKDKDILIYESLGFFDENSKVPQWIQNSLTDLFSFVTMHYFVWSWPFLLLFYFLHQWGLDYVSFAMITVYLPSFFSGTQKTGKGNEWELLRTSSAWGLLNKFLRIKIIREQELEPSKRYIFGLHPHGILVLSRIALAGRNFIDVFPGIAIRDVSLTIVLLMVLLVLGASAMYYIPLGREMCLWMGGVDASRSTGEKVLKEGNSIIVYPGGVPEIFRSNPNSKVVRCLLKKRLGFIKLAVNHGADLVPTFVFGEKWLYKYVHKGHQLGLHPLT
ncbi:hypothetical protein PHMEG_00032734 [Phytophthora megakarya]|uniref:diacylglycerol O-acyltransferase n=1 Tax=Phytophthora megakarya TaxID=4795 RepID=A0A225UV23_9STRA|nr:hypothetical protein PHMEG_00032734 [Phytophthora megakarya]